MTATATKRALRPAQRLLQRAEFRRVYEQGVRRHSPDFVVFALTRHLALPPGSDASGEAPAPPDPPSRFGITVSRKLGRATVRNRIRRRTREILRLHAPELGSGWDVVINPRRSVLTADFSGLERQLLALLRQLSSPSASRRT